MELDAKSRCACSLCESNRGRVFAGNLCHSALTVLAFVICILASDFYSRAEETKRPRAIATNLWSLKPVKSPELPAVKNRAWPRNGIDYFILEKLEATALAPSREADRTTLIRRLSFDLTGLPPTPEEIDEFLSDASPQAYENMVERLLASPRYGECWARHWLDVARYTESQGFEYDHMRPNAWHYRDYVIASFNSDKPYNQFVKEQIAGDAMAPVTPERIIATSLLVCGPWDQAGNGQANATQRAITHEEELEDLISVVGQTFLGLTINCARCHAHKFDPIPQEDYYRMKAVFEGVRHGERVIATESEIKARELKIAALKHKIAAEEKESEEESVRQLERDRKEFKAIPELPVSYSGTRVQPEPTHLLKRGDVKSPGETMTPGALSAVVEPNPDFGLPADAPEAARRLRLADWIIDPRNPLTARVIANRIWHYHFGTGIVATPNDLGSSGATPSHPELLDWLASMLVKNGWSLKALHRAIVCSATYRQASEFNPAAARIDSENRLLWRFSPRRLEAEELRDAMLEAGGSLNLAQGGPSVRSFDTKSFNATFYFPKDKIGPEFDRRTIYRMNVNSGKDPLLDAFDCPDPGTKTPRRGVTTTPLQALSLMNNSFVQREAENLAKRVLKESKGDLASAINRAYRHTLSRSAARDELARAVEIAIQTDLKNVCWALLNSTEFLYVR